VFLELFETILKAPVNDLVTNLYPDSAQQSSILFPDNFHCFPGQGVQFFLDTMGLVLIQYANGRYDCGEPAFPFFHLTRIRTDDCMQYIEAFALNKKQDQVLYQLRRVQAGYQMMSNL
jgi:hypothetical protein